MHSAWSEHKYILSGLVPSRTCICWKSSSVFLYCPAFTYLASLLFLGKAVQLYRPWCQCSHLCCHPRGVSVDPQAIEPTVCLLILEIQVPCIDPQMDQIKLIHHRFRKP